jgi:response regulator RpfG family c-di-GMP phosphodiesterase
MKSGPIILIEDDVDDKEILEEVLKELQVNNELIWFSNCLDAYEYLLNTTQRPFIIISDVNLPGQNGLEFKRHIDQNHLLRNKSIPFIFYSTAVPQESVNIAYKEMSVQGFFQKEQNYEMIKSKIKNIVEYWKDCKHPNS